MWTYPSQHDPPQRYLKLLMVTFPPRPWWSDTPHCNERCHSLQGCLRTCVGWWCWLWCFIVTIFWQVWGGVVMTFSWTKDWGFRLVVRVSSVPPFPFSWSPFLFCVFPFPCFSPLISRLSQSQTWWTLGRRWTGFRWVRRCRRGYRWVRTGLI